MHVHSQLFSWILCLSRLFFFPVHEFFSMFTSCCKCCNYMTLCLGMATAAALEKQQIPDCEQASTCALGEECHESDTGLGRK